MKKVLLIGEKGDIARSLKECLEDDFRVQPCAEKLANVQALIRVVKPDLAIICHIGAAEIDREVFEWICDNEPSLPILGIATNESWKNCRDFYQSRQFEILFRPVAKADLLRKCHQMLAMEQTELKAVKTYSSGERFKILLVDDSAIMLRSMKSMLERHYDICLAKSGKQALKLIPLEQPDLILLDYEMAGMNGKETFEEIKAQESMRDIPVVFLTGVTDRTAIYSVLKSKPDGYILKPPDESRIFDTIDGIFREYYKG